MATFLFDSIIFGPIKSRRLGISLGINLLPTDTKLCSFNCIYCECGLNPEKHLVKPVLPNRSEVKLLLKKKLTEMSGSNELPDVITFAGNGEPTLHPDFAGIIDDSIELRNILAPKARIAVLSNASKLGNVNVFNALLKVDDNIQKLDSAFPKTISLLDNPNYEVDILKLTNQLKAFQGKVIIQTLFVRGSYNGIKIDNTTPPEIDALINIYKEVNPSMVMIYSIDRDTPVKTLEKVPKPDIELIEAMVKSVGLKVQASV